MEADNQYHVCWDEGEFEDISLHFVIALVNGEWQMEMFPLGRDMLDAPITYIRIKYCPFCGEQLEEAGG